MALKLMLLDPFSKPFHTCRRSAKSAAIPKTIEVKKIKKETEGIEREVKKKTDRDKRHKDKQ